MCFKAISKMLSGRTERVAQIAAAERQTKADEAIREAMRPAQDSEPARQSSDNALKRLLGRRGAASTIAFGGRGDMSAPQLGFKKLMGA